MVKLPFDLLKGMWVRFVSKSRGGYSPTVERLGGLGGDDGITTLEMCKFREN